MLRWFIYTVLSGLIPLFMRALVVSSSSKRSWDLLMQEGDIIMFGIVLCLSNINELHHLEEMKKELASSKWAKNSITWSSFSLLVFGGLLIISYARDVYHISLVDKQVLFWESVACSSVVLLLSTQILFKINR